MEYAVPIPLLVVDFVGDERFFARYQYPSQCLPAELGFRYRTGKMPDCYQKIMNAFNG